MSLKSCCAIGVALAIAVGGSAFESSANAASMPSAAHQTAARRDPAPVSSISVTPGDSWVELTWMNPPRGQLDGVVVRRTRGTDPAASPRAGRLVVRTHVPQHRAVDIGLQPKTTYTYTLFPYQGSHYGVPQAMTVTTAPRVATVRPSVSGLSAAPTDSSVTLHWELGAPPTGSHVVVRRATGATAPSSPADGAAVADVATTQSSVTDADTVASTTYAYAVFLLDSSDQVIGSATVAVTTTRDTTGPGAVSAVNVDTFDHFIAVAWRNPAEPDLAGVVARRARGLVPPASPHQGEAAGDVTDTPPGQPTVYFDSALESNATYSYSLFSYDNAGNYGTPVSFTVHTRPDDTAPGGVSSLAASSTRSEVSLRWTQPVADDLASTIVTRGDVGTYPTSPTDGRVVAILRPGETGAVDRRLAPATDYRYTVFTIDHDGNSSQSRIAASTLPAIAPVTGLTLKMSDKTGVLAWTNPNAVDLGSIVVRRKVGTSAPTAADDGTPVATLAATQTSFIDRGVEPATTYTYSVFAVDKQGVSAVPVSTSGTSAAVDVTGPDPVSGLAAFIGQRPRVEFVWGNPQDVDLAKIVIRRQAGNSALTSVTDGEPVAELAPSITEYVANVPADADYRYAFFAVDTAGNVSDGRSVYLP
jgi:chitodextrinase